ncbi:hypothetical protein IC757_14820 [Wenzhouxiangella sp. AB-CW3]|uniref:M14 family zinc carboxypeptidase n=1 Tax=Wenzhouxiangella sp. AB-CW3 TaxID=2771012 RepID=UPI00168AE17E|nr:M14 family zinc carboxypeptidase [Wenzhouxiangella sp. AB-CW3]QOC22273.1 hypothetical protein IC757_14820 [Wenzhouxiangella sp. AB-CW3]
MKAMQVLAAVMLLTISFGLAAMPGLPDDFPVDETIPTPAEVLGFEPGEWHPRYDQMVTYLETLAEASDRVHLERIGMTHGQRPLLFLTFASPERLARIDEIRAARRDASEAGEGPAVAWLGYSVHGNEASGATAALVTAWYLAASQDEEVKTWLEEMIIVMEPGLNPDGIDRFAHWVNMHRGRHPSADPADREHNEAWPNGRTNYYWFDLNRDWLPLIHPESQARKAQYHAWRPHVLTDHHEMGAETTYFFQPGVPERNNPLTPERNYELTASIAEFHGEFLDRAGEPHFTRELFDDYYVGKGSTYPDLTGGIGILFEQGSARGHLKDTQYGKRSFADAVANQVTTSLSTLAATHALAEELIDFQREFFAETRDQARRDRNAGWVLGDDGDPVRAARLIELLLGHDIAIHPVTEAVDLAGRRHQAGEAWVIPADQPHYLLLKSILDPVTDLPMETFYDVSAWPLGMSHDLPLETMRRLPAHGERLEAAPEQRPEPPASDALAWVVPWNQYRAGALLGALLDDGYRVQAATEPLTVATPDGEREMVRGSLIVHSGIQPDHLDPVGPRLVELSQRHAVAVETVRRGLAVSGIDLGSPSAPVLDSLKPAMLTGNGLRANHAGYLWHWLDVELDQPLSMLDWTGLFRVDLDEYSHLILPDGNYEALPGGVRERIVEYVQGGGILIALRAASTWVEELDLDWRLVDAESNDDAESEEPPERRPYGDFRQDFARELIGGSALRLLLDTTHPLAFGYERDELVAFRRGRFRMRAVDNAYAQPAIYADSPLAAGYLSEANRDRLAGAPAISASRHGEGTVIRMSDDAVFRGYWRGTERLLANALFFGQLIGTTELPEGQ